MISNKFVLMGLILSLSAQLVPLESEAARYRCKALGRTNRGGTSYSIGEDRISKSRAQTKAMQKCRGHQSPVAKQCTLLTCEVFSGKF